MTAGNQRIWATFICAAVAAPSMLMAHGDVTPQAIDTSALPDIGEEWLEENPWRSPEEQAWAPAIEIGASGYNSNCSQISNL